MKIRNGFVSNSSSSSFVVKKASLTAMQIEAIHNHIEVASWLYEAGLRSHAQVHLDNEIPIVNLYERDNDNSDYDGWGIEETNDEIKLSTTMDNFDMRWFLGIIGVDDSDIKPEEC